MRSYHLLSASWDQTIKVWNLSNSGLTALTSLTGHESIVYTGSWSPKMSGILVLTWQSFIQEFINEKYNGNFRYCFVDFCR